MSRPTSQTRRFRLALVAVAVIAVAVVLAGLYRADVRRAEMEARQDLFVLMELRRSALEEFLRTIRSEVVLWSERGSVATAVADLTEAWRAATGTPSDRFRRLYMDENPYPAADRERLSDPGDGSAYSRLHAQFHPRVMRFRDHHEYHDVLLVDAAGNLVYSLAKEDDFGTNLLDGRWSETGLGKVVRSALQADDPRHVAFTDFEPYGPSDGDAASFIASPVFDGNGVRVGVLAFQLPTNRVDEILQFAEGLGESGEIYVVGADDLMHSESRTSDGSTRFQTRVDTESVDDALAGRSGVRTETNYHGADVFTAYGPLQFEGLTWALIAEIERAEVRATVRDPRRAGAKLLLALSLAGSLVCLILMAQLGREGRPTPWREQ